MRNVTIRQLQIFVEATRLGSFALTAERLHITPAAVSFQIKQLESMIGFSLFERVGKKPVLTAPGITLLGYAQTVLRALQDADQALRAMKGLSGGRVTIGLISTAKYIVPHILARFQASHPGTDITLRDGNRQEIFDALIAGTVDLAVTGLPPPDLVITASAFVENPSIIVAAPNHKLTRYTHLPVTSVVNEPFIAREPGSGTRQLMDAFFHSAGLSSRISMTSSSNETIKQAVMAGMGLALVSRHTVGLELRLGLLKELPVEGLPLRRSWYVAHRRGMPLLPIHQLLLNFMLERGQSIIDTLDPTKAEATDHPPWHKPPR